VRGAGEITCRELVELVTDYLEGALSRDRRTLFEEHIRMCDGCAAYLDQMRRTKRALGTLIGESISAEARDALLHAFRGWTAA
jgi:anti-sigma factor RsiW